MRNKLFFVTKNNPVHTALRSKGGSDVKIENWFL